jgi:hypothetical protein
MTKIEALEYLKQKHTQTQLEAEPVGELPTSRVDIEDEMLLAEGFGEHQRRNSKEFLTSDEH